MDTLKDKLKAYKTQKEQAYQIYIKSIGAIEILEALIKDSESEKKKKQFFEIKRGQNGKVKQRYC